MAVNPWMGIPNGGTPSRIELRIERLTLDGFALDGARAEALRMALEGELSRLLAEGGLNDPLTKGGALPTLPQLDASLAVDGSPEVLGRELACILYDGINNRIEPGGIELDRWPAPGRKRREAVPARKRGDT